MSSDEQYFLRTAAARLRQLAKATSRQPLPGMTDMRMVATCLRATPEAIFL